MKQVACLRLVVIVAAFAFVLSSSATVSAQVVGVGEAVFTPSNLFHVHKNGSLGVVYQGTNNSTGSSSFDGFQIDMTTVNVQLKNWEIGSLALATNNIDRLLVLGNGNVGINNPAPTERLDVVGNVRFSGDLRPNNLPGTSGQVLTSSGPGVAPVWSSALMRSNIYFDFSSANLNLTAAWAVIPGMTRVLNLTAGDRVILTATGGAYASGVNNVDVDVAFFINGALPINGGYGRVSADYSGANWSRFVEYHLLSFYDVPVTGAYTFTVQAIRTLGTGGIVGGNNTQVSQGTMMLQVLKP